jgi:co-chaperonin GroES (HSP10)
MVVLGRAVLIKPDKLPERTETGHLIIPETSKEMLPETGEVIQAGRACKEIKAGARVIFPRRSASVIVIDNQDYYLTHDYKITYHE